MISMIITNTADASAARSKISAMRAAGQEVYERLMRGDVRKIDVEVLAKGPDVAQAAEIKYTKLELVRYTTGTGAARITAEWIRLNTGPGVTVLPIFAPHELETVGVVTGNVESVLMIHKPQPSVGKYTVELVSGGIKPKPKDKSQPDAKSKEVIMETGIEAADRELIEEAGCSAEKYVHLMDVTHAPYRINEIDWVYVAKQLQFVGRKGEDKEERPIVPIILTMPEVKDLLRESQIYYAATVASITTYLLRSQENATWAPA